MIERSPFTAWHTIGQRVLLVPLERKDGVHNNLLVLSGSGPFLWGQLETPRSQEELVSALLSEYAVGSEQATTDVQGFLAQLTEWQAIRPA